MLMKEMNQDLPSPEHYNHQALITLGCCVPAEEDFGRNLQVVVKKVAIVDIVPMVVTVDQNFLEEIITA